MGKTIFCVSLILASLWPLSSQAHRNSVSISDGWVSIEGSDKKYKLLQTLGPHLKEDNNRIVKSIPALYQRSSGILLVCGQVHKVSIWQQKVPYIGFPFTHIICGATGNLLGTGNLSQLVYIPTTYDLDDVYSSVRDFDKSNKEMANNWERYQTDLNQTLATQIDIILASPQFQELVNNLVEQKVKSLRASVEAELTDKLLRAVKPN